MFCILSLRSSFAGDVTLSCDSPDKTLNLWVLIDEQDQLYNSMVLKDSTTDFLTRVNLSKLNTSNELVNTFLGVDLEYDFALDIPKVMFFKQYKTTFEFVTLYAYSKIGFKDIKYRFNCRVL